MFAVFAVPAQVDGSETVSSPEVVVNRSIALLCPASGIPVPEIRWFLDGEEIFDNSSRFSLVDGGWKLEIDQAEVDDAARYSCRAKNVAGQSEKYYDLHVLGECSRDIRSHLIWGKFFIGSFGT